MRARHGIKPLHLFQLTPDKPLGGRSQGNQQVGAWWVVKPFLAEDMHLPDHSLCGQAAQAQGGAMLTVCKLQDAFSQEAILLPTGQPRPNPA